MKGNEREFRALQIQIRRTHRPHQEHRDRPVHRILMILIPPVHQILRTHHKQRIQERRVIPPIQVIRRTCITDTNVALTGVEGDRHQVRPIHRKQHPPPPPTMMTMMMMVH